MYHVSGKEKEVLQDWAKRYLGHLEKSPEEKIGELCWNANAGKSHFEHRVAIVTETSGELKQKLMSLEKGELPSGVFKGIATS